MHLDHRPLEGVEGVQNGDGSVGEAPRIDDDSIRRFTRLLNPVNDPAFVIRLEKAAFKAKLARQPCAILLNVRQRLAAIDFRLAQAQQVEVRAVDDLDASGHCHYP